jgi:hypothetical protein
MMNDFTIIHAKLQVATLKLVVVVPVRLANSTNVEANPIDMNELPSLWAGAEGGEGALGKLQAASCELC